MWIKYVLNVFNRWKKCEIETCLWAPRCKPSQVCVCGQEKYPRYSSWSLDCRKASGQSRGSIFHNWDLLCWPKVHSSDWGSQRVEECSSGNDHPPRNQHISSSLPHQDCQSLLSLHSLTASLEGNCKMDSLKSNQQYWEKSWRHSKTNLKLSTRMCAQKVSLLLIETSSSSLLIVCRFMTFQVVFHTLTDSI